MYEKKNETQSFSEYLYRRDLCCVVQSSANADERREKQLISVVKWRRQLFIIYLMTVLCMYAQ